MDEELNDYLDPEESAAIGALTPEELAEIGLPVPAAPAAAEPEPAPATPAAEPAPAAQAQQAAQPQAETVEPDQQAAPMIPKARFDEVLRRQQDAEQRAAFLAGKAEALQAQLTQTPPTPATPPEPSPAEKLATAYAALDAQFKEGEIGTDEYLAQRGKLDDEKIAIRVQEAVAKAIPKTAPALIDEYRLNEMTAQLCEQHPYAALITEQQALMLQTLAMQNAQINGKAYDINTTAGLYELRRDVAILSDQFGPGLIGKTLPPAAGAAPQSAAKPQMSQQAQARSEKLELQKTMPPDINAVGRVGGVVGLTDEAITQMAATNPRALEDISPAELARLTQS